MSRLLNYFFRGLIILAPAVVTVYIFWLIISTVDQWMGLPIPGAGIAITIVLVTLFGFLTSSVLARWILAGLDTLFQRLPLVRLVYTSTRDLLDAFVGEKRRFDRPVIVATSTDGAEKAFGFVTQQTMARFGLEDHVTVYLPFSYTFTGVIRMYPAERVTPIAADSAQVMAFVVSGGVTQVTTRDEPPT